MSDVKLELINELSPEVAIADIVFLHGLGGDYKDTWTNKKHRIFWPSIIANENPDIHVWSLNYSSQLLANVFTGNDQDFFDQTTLIYKLLEAKGLGNRPFIFICHSLGGLFAKAILRKSSDLYATTRIDWLENCKGVIFFATPHNGSSLSNILSLLPFFPSKVSRILRSNNGFLRDLSDFYVPNSHENKIDTLAFCEDKLTKGLMVVDQESASPKTNSGYPIKLPTNHIDICKIKDTSQPEYIIVNSFLKNNLTIEENEEIKLKRPRGESYLVHLKSYFDDRPKEVETSEGEIIDLTLEEISRIPSNNKVQKIFRDLVSKVYSDHASDTISGGEFSEGKVSIDGIPDISRSKITSMFHNSFIVPSTFKQTKRGGETLSFVRFTKRLSKRIQPKYTRSKLGENEILLLVGEVGRGKSTVLTHLMYKHKIIFQQNNFVPVRIDFEKISSKGQINIEIFFSSLVSKLSNAFHNHVRMEDDCTAILNEELRIRDEIVHRLGQLPSDNLLETEIKSCLAQYIKEISHRFEINFLLILDNLDAQYHVFDRHIFSQKGIKYREDSVNSIKSIFDSFDNTQAEPLANMSLRVLLVLRPETRKYFSVSKIRNVGHRTAADVFLLKAPTLRKVILERNKMLSKLCEMHVYNLTKDEAKYLVHFLNQFSRDSEGVLRYKKGAKGREVYESNLKTIEKYSNQGLRRTVDHMSRYVWLNEENANLSDRFENHHTSQILCFLLGDKCRFHQFNSYFQNLFLTRGDLVGDRDDLGTYNNNVRYHPQTYWLKYLVAYFVKLGSPVSVDIVISIFSFGGKYYPRELVEFCMASISHVETTNLVTPKFRPSVSGFGLTIESLKITDCGKQIFEYLVWSFEYLQLVVEDPYLPIPKLWSDDFNYEEGLDYGYFVESNDAYNHSKNRMIRLKARQVFLFLHILENTLKFEMERYPGIFSILEKSGYQPPDFDLIRNNIEKSVSNLLLIGADKGEDSSEIEPVSIRDMAAERYRTHHEEFKKIYKLVW